MPKTRSSEKSASSSSADSSESSYDCPKKCTKKCDTDCSVNICECTMAPEELVCKVQDAVVGIHSEFILVSADTAAAGVTGATPLAANSRDDVFINGNGFFIKGHYIVCPAHLVLLPPSITSVAHRFPFGATLPALGTIRDEMVRASRILVSVNNVNGKKRGYTYEAELIGVDGAGDVAVLHINYDEEYNRGCSPKIEKCHPYLSWGSSRAANKGQKVWLIGDYISSDRNVRAYNAAGAVVEAVVSDNRYVDYEGFALPEQVLVSGPAYAFSSGLPIINCKGYVIGMQTADISGFHPTAAETQAFGIGFVAGPSEFSMKRSIAILIKASCCKEVDEFVVESVSDQAGQYWRLLKGYLGLAYELVTATDYDTTTDFTSGVAPLGRARVRLDSSGNFIVCPRNKQIVGIRVVGLAGLNPNDQAAVANGFWYVPGGSGATAPLPDNLPTSSLSGRILPGDIITHFGKYCLGDLERQIAPSLVTWRLNQRCMIDVSWKRGGNVLNSASNGEDYENYDHSFRQRFSLQRFPRCLDYPWYKVNAFPLVSNTVDPVGFTFPVQQIVNPQVIQRNIAGAGLFHPAM